MDDDTYKKCKDLLAEADLQIMDSIRLTEARELAAMAGLTVDLPHELCATASTTGGHSNTDHQVHLTGDYTFDRLADLRRNYLARRRSQLPEMRGEDRWDKPRRPGERRRRIVREADLPAAPPHPPPSGYTIFVGQMTTKLRYQRPHERHSQAAAMKEISQLWRTTLRDAERQWYNEFCEQVRAEYAHQRLEFRATGHYQPSQRFERVQGANLWVHTQECDKNDLEKEIAGYDTVVFPLRPPQFDKEYKQREIASKERRKQKLKAERRAKRQKRQQQQPPLPLPDLPEERQPEQSKEQPNEEEAKMAAV